MFPIKFVKFINILRLSRFAMFVEPVYSELACLAWAVVESVETAKMLRGSNNEPWTERSRSQIKWLPLSGTNSFSRSIARL